MSEQAPRQNDLETQIKEKFAGYTDVPGKGNVLVPCEHCQKTFRTYAYLRKRGIARFCSVTCKTIGTRKPRALRDDAVQLSSGNWTLVSAEDLEWARTLALNESNGYASKFHNPFHRMVYERATGSPIPVRMYIDHINGNTLDNRRQNLRLSTNPQNMANTGLRRTNTSGYKGVYRNKRRWAARLTLLGQNLNIGTFDTPEIAAWMYDTWAMQLCGSFARTNFEYRGTEG